MGDFDEVMSYVDELVDGGEPPRSSLFDELASGRDVELDVRGLSMEDIQTLALRNLILGSMAGDVQASRALMTFTEDVSSDQHDDLHKMTAMELADESRRLAIEFKKLEVKEALAV